MNKISCCYLVMLATMLSVKLEGFGKPSIVAINNDSSFNATLLLREGTYKNQEYRVKANTSVVKSVKHIQQHAMEYEEVESVYVDPIYLPTGVTITIKLSNNKSDSLMKSISIARDTKGIIIIKDPNTEAILQTKKNPGSSKYTLKIDQNGGMSLIKQR